MADPVRAALRVARAYPRDTPERAENATRHRAGAEGWRMENDNDRCPEHSDRRNP